MIYNFFRTQNRMERVPLTVYQILRSAAYDADTEPDALTLTTDYREAIFDFDYPLSTSGTYASLVIDEEWFESTILQHYILRRIGFDTVGEFKRALYVKLNQIMPYMLQKRNLYISNIGFYELLNLYTEYTGKTYDITLNDDNTVSITGDGYHGVSDEVQCIASGDEFFHRGTNDDTTRSKEGTSTDTSTTTTTTTGSTSGSTSNTVNSNDTTANTKSELSDGYISNIGSSSAVSEVAINTKDGTDTTTGTTSGSTSGTTTDSVSTVIDYNSEDSISDYKGSLSWKEYDTTAEGKYTSGALENNSSDGKNITDTNTGTAGYSKVELTPENIKKLGQLFDQKFNWLSEIYKELDELFLTILD